MNANMIINMVTRLLMRKVINGGINAGVNAVSNKMGKGSTSDAPPQDTADTQKRLRQGMKVSRRIGRM